MKKVFISFDFDEDKALKDLFIGQAKNPVCPFEVIDSSLIEPAPEKNWEEKAERNIGKADLVIVLLGARTHQAHGTSVSTLLRPRSQGLRRGVVPRLSSFIPLELRRSFVPRSFSLVPFASARVCSGTLRSVASKK